MNIEMSKLTKKKAKEITLEVWEYFRNHPSIKIKHDLPPELWNKIQDMDGLCPLCEYHPNNCDNCPLPINEFEDGSCFWYVKWSTAGTPRTRKKYASKIVAVVKEW